MKLSPEFFGPIPSPLIRSHRHDTNSLAIRNPLSEILGVLLMLPSLLSATPDVACPRLQCLCLTQFSSTPFLRYALHRQSMQASSVILELQLAKVEPSATFARSRVFCRSWEVVGRYRIVRGGLEVFVSRGVCAMSPPPSTVAFRSEPCHPKECQRQCGGWAYVEQLLSVRP